MFDTLNKLFVGYVISYTYIMKGLIRINFMNSNDSREINSSIRIAVDNANKRIGLLSFSDKKCVIEEYKEWINEDINCHNVLFLREDPII